MAKINQKFVDKIFAIRNDKLGLVVSLSTTICLIIPVLLLAPPVIHKILMVLGFLVLAIKSGPLVGERVKLLVDPRRL